MTTVIAIETEHGATWGWDSLCSNGEQIIELTSPKVFANNGVVYGVSGSLKTLQKLQYGSLPAPDDWDTDLFVQKKLKAVRKTLKNGYSSALCSINGRVYDMDGDCWIRNTTGIYATGSGSTFALGALLAGATVMEALEIAAQNDPFTGGKLTVKVEGEILD